MTLASRYLPSNSTNMADVATEENLMRFSVDLCKHVQNKISRSAFTNETDIGWVQGQMSTYRENMDDTKNGCMKTIVEEETFPIDSSVANPTLVSGNLARNDRKHLAKFHQLLAKNEVDDSFRERLQEVIQIYAEIAAMKAASKDSSLEHELFFLRDEVQAQSFQWQKMTREQVLDSQKVERLPARIRRLMGTIG